MPKRILCLTLLAAFVAVGCNGGLTAGGSADDYDEEYQAQVEIFHRQAEEQDLLNKRAAEMLDEQQKDSERANAMLNEQMKEIERSGALLDRQIGQTERYEKLLSKWEEHTRRMEAILEADEKRLGIQP